jgi:hypothetical protein
MNERRAYKIFITVNSKHIRKVIIDPHYELKHGKSVDDKVIINLVHQLDRKTFKPEAEKDNFKYFKVDPLELDGVNYRLVWLLEENEIYIGVVNAFRR